MTRWVSISITIVAMTAGWVFAATPNESSKNPSETSAPTAQSSEPLSATVVSVTGVAEKFTAGKWEPLKAKEKLDELAIIRTGLRSKVVLKFADRGQVTVNSGTKVGISQFRKEGDLVRAHLGLKYGTMRATVDATRGPNDVRISTPVSTLSVRGSDAQIGFSSDGGLGLQAQSGQWQVAAGQRTRNIVAGQTTNSNLTPPITLAQQQRDPRMGDTFGGLTPQERQRLIMGDNTPLAFPGQATGGVPTVPSPEPPPNHIILGM